MDITYDWPEWVGAAFLILGLAFALFAANLYILYIICILMGLVFGRIWYKYRVTHCVPVFITLLAFFLGFILGSVYSNLRAVAILILAGTVIGYWLHKKKIIRTI